VIIIINKPYKTLEFFLLQSWNENFDLYTDSFLLLHLSESICLFLVSGVGCLLQAGEILHGDLLVMDLEGEQRDMEGCPHWCALLCLGAVEGIGIV